MKHSKLWLVLMTGIGLFFQNHPARADEGVFSIGLEAYGDQYKEPEPDVNNHAGYGGITAAYVSGGQSGFWGVDARADYGLNTYNSPDGTSKNTPQYEVETRLFGGPAFSLGGGDLRPYLGLGGRFFYDQGDGTFTDLGFGGYDRYIEQIYIPVGASWTFHTDSWTITPNAEYDQLIYGHVWSGLAGFTGYNVSNTQDNGYGLRGSLMFGTRLGNHVWQFGPFARYWDMKDSQVTVGPDGTPWIEPHNTRFQAGAQVRMLFW